MRRRLFLAVLAVSFISGLAHAAGKSAPTLYPSWFLQPDTLGVQSWDTVDETPAAASDGISHWIYKAHTRLDGKRIVALVKDWGHHAQYESVDDVGEGKVALEEVDISRDPAHAGERIRARKHNRVISIEMEDEHVFVLTISEYPAP